MGSIVIGIQGRQQNCFQQPSGHRGQNYGAMTAKDMKPRWA